MARWSVAGLFLDGLVARDFDRLHLAWRLRVRPAPRGIGAGWHLIEQQAYADASEVITAIDLLCSGFTPEGHHDARGGGRSRQLTS